MAASEGVDLEWAIVETAVKFVIEHCGQPPCPGAKTVKQTCSV